MNKKYIFVFVQFISIILLQSLLAQTPGTVKWSLLLKRNFSPQYDAYCSPAIFPDGTIIAEAYPYFYIINSDGTEIGKSFLIYGGKTPVIGPDCTTYIGNGRTLYAFNPDGSKKWEFGTDGYIYIGPAVDSDGTIYIGSGNILYALNYDGTIKWFFQTNSKISASPAIGLDGTIYFTTTYDEGMLYAINPDGSKKWEIKIREFFISSPYSSPIIDNDGTIYIANSDYQLSAINPDGTVKWKIKTNHDSDSHFFTTPVIGLDNIIYISTDDDYLYAVQSDGTIKWNLYVNDSHMYSPAIGSDGTIYVVSGTALQAINLNGTLEWIFESNYTIHSNPAIASDGTIIFESYDRIYAIYTESTGLANSAWPKFGKNNQNQDNNHNLHCPRAKVAQNYISCNLGSVVTLDGSLSSDPDGDLLNYKWRIIDKPEEAIIILSDSISSKINVSIPDTIYSDYLFSLTVDDYQDGSSVAVVKVHVNRIKWMFATDSQEIIKSCPAINKDGSVYFMYEAEVCGLYALNIFGELIFKLSCCYEGPLSSAVICPDGTVVYGEDHRIVAVNPEERVLKWWSQHLFGYGYVLEPSVNTDGTIYAGNGNIFYAINQDGTTRLTYRSSSEIYQTSSAIDINGDIFFTSSNYLIALDPNCIEKWSYYLDGGSSNALSIGPYGTIYVSVSKDLFAINPDGSKQWSVTTYDEIGTSAVIDTSGNIYIGSGHYLYSINSEGKFNWAKYFDCSITHGPAIGSGSIIYLGNDSTFFAVGEDGSIKWSIKTDDKIVSPVAMDSNGVAYFSTSVRGPEYFHCKIFAIQTDSKELAHSSWPKYRSDARNTCRVSPVTNQFLNMDAKDLSVGNKYFYKHYDYSGGPLFTTYSVETVIENIDSVATIEVNYINSNNIKYRYERCDSTKLFEKLNGIWTLVFDLGWNMGDTVKYNCVVVSKGISEIFGNSKLYYGYQRYEEYYKFYQQFGLTTSSYDGGVGLDYSKRMIGAIIDGIAYGDTTNYKNNPPIIVSTPPTELLPDYPYKYIIEIEDESKDNIYGYPTVKLIKAPEWLSLRKTWTDKRNWYLKGWTPDEIGVQADVSIKVTDIHGASSTQSFTISVVAPKTFNYPNPFNNETTIHYYVPKEGSAIISIFDINGNLVDKIIDSGKKRGQYSITWTPENCQSGLYIYKIVLGAYSKLGKMMLLK